MTKNLSEIALYLLVIFTSVVAVDRSHLHSSHSRHNGSRAAHPVIMGFPVVPNYICGTHADFQGS